MWQTAYHRQLGELLDLLDCSWSALLERYAMDLWVCKILDQSSVQYSCFWRSNGMNHPVDFIKLDLSKTYSLVQVDCVFARDDIGDG